MAATRMGPTGRYARSPSSVTACTASSPRVRSPSTPTNAPRSRRPATRSMESISPSAMMSGFAAGIDRGEHGVHLLRIALVHCHRDMQPALVPADASHQFEAAQVCAEEKRPPTGVEPSAHQRLALDRNVESIVLSVDEEHAIVDAGGEIQDVPEAVHGAWTPVQGEPQVATRMPPRAGCEQKEIRRDAVQQAAAHRASHAQR